MIMFNTTIDTYDEILKQIEEGNQVNVLYIDFEKCFDKIDFNPNL